MFSRISNRLHDWINRTEPHQESTNGDLNGANAKESEIKENLNCEKKGINEDTNLIQNEQESENESRIEKEREFEVVKKQEQEKSRINEPVQPEAEDSFYRLQTGLCELGMNCKFCHCPSSKTQYFDQHGGCKSGEACNFDNNRMTSLGELNFMGLPIRPGEQDCPYYMHHGSCKFEANCRFNHPDPTSVGESDKPSEHINEGSSLSTNSSQSPLGSCPPASGESLPYVHLTFPSTQGIPSHPERPAYQGPVYPRGRSVQVTSGCATNNRPLERNVYKHHQHQQILVEGPVYSRGRSIQVASGCATNNRPLERNVYTHHQHQQILVEFPERPGQPECSNFLKTGTCRYRSACKYHHPKNESTKSTSSGLPAVQPMIQKAFASPSSDASFTKMFAGQNLASNVDKSNVKRPKEVPNKKSASQKVRCDLCQVECTSIQLYENHLIGKKHTFNLEKLQALRLISPAGQASKPINTFCTASEMGIPNGNGMASVATEFKTMKQSTCSAGDKGTPSPSRNSELPKEKIASQKVRCDVCNVECPNIQLYKNHSYGKRHKNNLEKLLSVGIIFPAGQAQPIKTSCTAGVMATPSVKCMAEATSVVTDFEAKKQNSFSVGEKGIPSPSGEGMEGFTDSEIKKQKLLEGAIAVQFLRVCTICDVVCNGEIAFSEHLVGKKHLAQTQIPAIIVNPIATSATIPKPKGNEEIAKKTNVVRSARCVLCNVTCTSFEDLICHKNGKKHKENIEKSQNPKTCATTPVPASSTARPPLALSKELNNLEVKKKNVLGCGAAADAVRICTICNVVCNSEKVFHNHLAGQKHAAFVKQKESGNDS